MTIKVDLFNIDEAIKQLEDYQTKLEEKRAKLLDEAAKLATVQASNNFANALYSGTNDVEVIPVVMNKNTVSIDAVGEAVAFIEFGTGVYNDVHHPLESEYGFKRGSFGYGLGKFKSWSYVGEPGTNGEPDPKDSSRSISHGDPANRCLYEAGKVVRLNIHRMAKEIFKT